jgi:hypothetical protein
MDAPVALFDNPFYWMNIPDFVRTRRHTVSSGNTSVWVSTDNAIVFDAIGFDRTDRNTDGLLTIIAQHWQKRSSHMGIFALLNLFHP